MEALLKAYLPYLIGTSIGLLVAFIISGLLTLQGTAQLMLFALLPAIGGAVVEGVSNADPIGPIGVKNAMGRLKEIVIDCDVPSRAAPFLGGGAR